MTGGKYIELFKDGSGRWRWRLKSPNGQTVSTAGESFFSKWNAKRAAKRVHPDVPIETWP